MLRIKDWQRFQRYKQSHVPWIKLYRKLLDDPEWHNLDPVDNKTLVGLWLIASESNTGELPSIEKLAFRLRVGKTSLESIISRLAHFVVSDVLENLPSQADDVLISLPSGVAKGSREGEGERERENLQTLQKESSDSLERDLVHKNEHTQPKGLSPIELMNCWNCYAVGLSKASKLTDRRKRKTTERLKENPDESYWITVFYRIQASPFLLGQTPHSGWKANFDWIIRNQDNAVAVLEGKYDRADREKTGFEKTMEKLKQASPEKIIWDEEDEALANAP